MHLVLYNNCHCCLFTKSYEPESWLAGHQASSAPPSNYNSKTQQIRPFDVKFLSIYFHTKRLYVHMFDIVEYSLQLWKRIDRLLIPSGIFQDKRKYSACDPKCRYCIFNFVGQSYYAEQFLVSSQTVFTKFVSYALIALGVSR